MGNDSTEVGIRQQFKLVVRKNAVAVRDFTNAGGDPLTLGIGENGNKR